MEAMLQMQADPLEQALQREMQPGERVMWRGRQLARIEWSAFAIWFFAIPWTAFSLFWTAMAWAGTQQSWNEVGLLGLAFPLFGTPFILVGFGMLSAPFLGLLGADRTMFAITNRRLVRVYRRRGTQVHSVAANRIGSFDRRERSDGSGRLRIEVGHRVNDDGDWRADHFDIGPVADVRLAEMQIRQLADRAGALPSS